MENTIGLEIDPETLLYSWTAEIEEREGEVTTIWWTAWAMIKRFNPKILSISSDYPRFEISKSYTRGCCPNCSC